MADDCLDPNKPTVDNSAIECKELISTNCIIAAESNIYLKWAKGVTLTKVLTLIASAIKKLTTAQTTYLPTYTTYTVVLEQVGIAIPTVAFTTNNSAALAPTYTYTAAGEYVLTSTGSFIEGKTVIIAPSNRPTYALGLETQVNEFSAERIDNNSISIKTAVKAGGVGTLTDGLLDGSNTTLEIRIYS